MPTPPNRSFGRRWIVGSVLVAAIVAGCVVAGFWQLRRLDERRATNEQVRARGGAALPLPAEGFGPGADADDLAFRRVAVAGEFDAANEVLLRFRTRKGLPGYEVVTPLVTADGVLLVNRGWVPLEQGDRWPVASAAPPTGRIELEGVLVPAEEGDLRLTEGRTRVAASLDPVRLAGALPYESVYRLPLLATGGSAAYPAPVEPPGLGDGPHRSYAVQWFVFASVGVLGWFTLLRRRGPWAPRRPTEPTP